VRSSPPALRAPVRAKIPGPKALRGVGVPGRGGPCEGPGASRRSNAMPVVGHRILLPLETPSTASAEKNKTGTVIGPAETESTPREGALTRDWMSSRAAVFFDFGDATEPDDRLRFDVPVLWRVMPDHANGGAFVSPVPKAAFRVAYFNGAPLGGFNSPEVAQSIAARNAARSMPGPQRRGEFAAYLARRDRARRRRLF
jgi:hypothetical protein